MAAVKVEVEHTTAFFIWSFHYHFVIACQPATVWHISILTIGWLGGVQNSPGPQEHSGQSADHSNVKVLVVLVVMVV